MEALIPTNNPELFEPFAYPTINVQNFMKQT
jgi:hypothetical protein